MTESSSSLNIITVTLDMEACSFLGFSVFSSGDSGEYGLFIRFRVKLEFFKNSEFFKLRSLMLITIVLCKVVTVELPFFLRNTN